MNDIRLLPSKILTRRLLDLVRQYYELGLTPIPCEPQSKKPTCEWGWWQHRRPSWEELEAVWWDAFARFGGQLNIATLLGKAHGLCAVDIDNPEAFKRARQAIGLNEGDLRTWTLLSHKGGALLFRYPQGHPLPARVRNSLWGAELLGDRHLRMLPPSIHPVGTPYHWLKGHEPDQIPLADIPEALLFAFVVDRPQPKSRPIAQNGHGLGVIFGAENNPQPQNGHDDGNGLPAWARSVVALLKPYWQEGWRHDTALALAGVLAKRGVPKEVAESILRELVREANDPEVKDRLRALMDTYDHLAKGESVLAWQGLKWLGKETLRALDRLLPEPPTNGHRLTLATIERPERPCTDLGNAERLVRLFGDRIRFVPQWGWLVWDGKRWARDAGHQRITELAEETVRQIYREAAETDNPEERAKLAKWAVASESRQRIAAMIDLAAPMCLASPDEFDADDWLLNLENGVLNLRTLEFLPHDPNWRLTKLAPVPYDPNADCPKWKAFLQRIFNNNERLIRFVQRAVGYSLTGSTREQCLFFLYGTGANGKSTFLEVIRALLGDYAVTAEFSTFVADRKGSVRNDIARLHSARLVTAIEVGEGKRFAEELIKTLTGGDTVAARFLYREFFEFRPRFKVWLAANYKPEIRGSDYAIWRRLRLIPFTVTIPPEEQIPNLAEQLKEELAGILNWALEGLRDWLANGLQPPPEVTEATEAYRAEMDIVGLFVQDACITDPTAVTPSKTLYDAFREWCAENGYEPFGQTAFGRRLAAKGFSHRRAYLEGRLRRCWFGLRLRTDTDPQPDLLPPDPPDNPDRPNMTDVTDVTRFSESCPIKSEADQSFGKTRHNLSSVTNASDPSVTSQNPTIACHRDEQVVQYPPSPCCGEPLTPDEEGVGVCVGCGRCWQWEGTSWHPANLWEFDPKEYGFPF
ncbi:MAG: phage/plasmid primase, P4 family [Armatimonadota bacterium]|jgi:putative DNA primase/helicase